MASPPPAPPVTDEDFPQGASKERPKKTDKADKPKKPNGELPADLPVPQGESAASLLNRDVPEPLRLCDPWATEGVNIIAGRPKLGKTTLERQKLAAAATGAKFLDSEFTHPCLCAFLSLEEGELLTRLKFKQANFSDTALNSIQLHFSWGRGYEGVDQLDRYLTANPDIQFVVIDSLSRFRAVPDSKTPAFTADYEAVNMLHEIAKAHQGVCFDVIHHTRKAKSDDPLDDISGTYGLSAAADCCVVLRHHSEGASMFTASRLWTREDDTYLLKRNAGQWEMLGVNMGLTADQHETIRVIKAAATGMGGKELGEKLGITQPSAWERIDLLIEKGFLVKRHGRAYLKGSI